MRSAEPTGVNSSGVLTAIQMNMNGPACQAWPRPGRTDSTSGDFITISTLDARAAVMCGEPISAAIAAAAVSRSLPTSFWVGMIACCELFHRSGRVAHLISEAVRWGTRIVRAELHELNVLKFDSPTSGQTKGQRGQ